MSTRYKNNHYVPQWYQKRFLLPGQVDNELFYLSLKTETFTDKKGTVREVRNPKKQGLRLCFKEDDLYTRWFGDVKYTDIEEVFFGNIDNAGRKAVDFFARFDHAAYMWDSNMFNALMLYMSTQKLRTPKGLGWLAEQVRSNDKNMILALMMRLQQLYGAIWTECVWQIADADLSDTKFIISDHPVTVYNRFLGPRNRTWSRGFNDPDITLNGTHTLFPLSLDKILILTNLSWVRNPYQSGVASRPNPNPFRPAMFNFQSIQTHRSLGEQEVREINFVIKNRALRHIGAAKEEWLYPESHISRSDWNTYGGGLLFMPDPRSVAYETETLIGYKDGRYDAFDEYGRKPWQEGYSGRSTTGDFNTLEQFKGDFATIFGPVRRGRSASVDELEPDRDSDEFHAYHLSRASKRYLRKQADKSKS